MTEIMKQFISVLFFFVFINFSQAQELEIPAYGTDSTFEVITWNIEWFPKNGQITVDYVNEIILDLNVDVVALQEIDDKTYFDQLLESLDGWAGYYVNSEYSNLAYIYNTEVIELIDVYEIYTTSEYWRPFPRAPMVMELQFMNQNYFIINNHFKCCGDGYMDESDPGDEETRRRDASILLEDYIKTELVNENVIMLGDLNDNLTDVPNHNVFNVFINNSGAYSFVDMAIAEGGVYNWSYPSWPSHLDHILITEELFDDFSNPGSDIQTLRLDDFFDGGFSEYDQNVSDHRPVALKIKPDVSTGIPAFDQQITSIYPNPCKDVLFLEKSKNSQLTITISDLSGLLLYKTILSSAKSNVDVSNLKKGMYILKAEDSFSSSSYLFIKQ